MSARYSFRPLRIDAGGTVSALALNAAGDTLVLGGDVEGIFRSEDGGDHWRVVNRGMTGDFFYRVACVAWSLTEPNTVYAGTGNPGSPTGAGFLASTDGGKSWTRRSTAVQFAGNHSDAPLPGGHPRSTGNLVAQGGGTLYAATYDAGVFRSIDNGFNWTNIGFSGGISYARSIAIDPVDPTTLYVALYNDKVWKTTDATAGTPSWTQLVNAPAVVEELVFVGSYLYAAAGSSGIYRSTDGGAGWDSLNGPLIDTTQSLWRAIDGFVSGSNHVIVAGCANGIIPGGDGRRSVVRLSIDSGGSITYTDLSSTSANIDQTIAPDNRTWWHAGSNYASWLGGTNYEPTHILIDPTNTDRIWIAGTEGVFRSLDGGATWQAAINGMPLTLHRRVLTDPSDPLHVFAAADDWTLFDVSDGVADNASTVTTHAPTNAGVGYGLAIDPSDSRIYLGVGDRDTNTKGNLFSRSAVNGTTWISEGLPTVGTLTTVASDTFSRSVTDSWGTADAGGAWALVSGTATSFSVDGAAALLQLPAGSGSRAQFLTSVSTQDCTGQVDVAWDRAPAGAGHFTQIFVRSNGTATRGYSFRVEQNPATPAVATIRFHKFADGPAQQIGGTQNIAYSPGETMTIRFSAVGTSPTTLSMKAWTGGPDFEPVDWMITMTDSEAVLQNAGSVGIRASGGSVSYTAAALFTYDNLQVDDISAGSGDPADKRPIGIAVGRDGSNNRTILAAVDTSGLWRKVNDIWTKVSTAITGGAQTTRYTGFVWQAGSQYVYAFDRASGVYRSDDYGVTWSQIWNISSDVSKTGFIAQDPSTPEELWISRSTGLFRLSNVQSGTAVGIDITSTQTLDVARPGPITITADGTIWCINLADTNNPAQLLRSTDSGTTWQDVSDESFKAMANRAFDITVAANGRVYVATSSTGVLMGYNIGQQQIT